MTPLEKINQDLTAAMKAKDQDRLSTLRMMKTAIKNKEIEKMGPVDDAEAIKVLQSMLKQRRDSIDQYTSAGRAELAAKEAVEVRIIEEYLPAALDETAILKVIDEVIAEQGGAQPQQMGLIMKTTMAKLAGQTVDGKEVSRLVKLRLG